MFHVRCIDYGILKNVAVDDMMALPRRFVDRLPAQSIECKIADICPVDGLSWSEEAGDLVYNLADYGFAVFRATGVQKICKVRLIDNFPNNLINFLKKPSSF